MWGRKLLLPAPPPCLPDCVTVRVRVVPNRAPEEISERGPPLLVGSSVVRALLGDVLAGDELAGGTRPQLLHGQAAHHLLVRRGCNVPRSVSLLALL